MYEGLGIVATIQARPFLNFSTSQLRFDAPLKVQIPQIQANLGLLGDSPGEGGGLLNLLLVEAVG